MRQLLVMTWVAVGSGCAPLYMPPGATLPQLSRGGDLQAAGSVGLNGTGLGAAYALSDLVAVRASGYGRGPNNSVGPALYGQVGAALFIGPGAQAARPGRYRAGGRFSLAVDVGVGAAESSLNSSFYSANYLRASVEGEAGYSSEYVAVGIAPRVSVASYRPTARDRNGAPETILYLEPVGVLRLGPPFLRGELQLGLSWPSSLGAGIGGPWPLILGLGLSSDLGSWERQKQEELREEQARRDAEQASPPLPGLPPPPPPPAIPAPPPY